ncbi:MAG TPA: NUDIX hydrolase [Blastocatellia bacterium]|nr:NUDIX hydrolase [Blastocatellia bacterium]
MYITPTMIAEVERCFGTPDVIAFAYEMKPNEFEAVRRSQKNGRAHDVTLFIIVGDRIAVIRKPMYPAGAYRAPSGGVGPGENFEAGALREAREETGLAVVLEKYLVRARVRFTCGPLTIAWTTHVLTARPDPDGPCISPQTELNPVDTNEIAEARLATVNEISGDIRNALLRARSTGLRYRVDLTDCVLARLT